MSPRRTDDAVVEAARLQAAKAGAAELAPRMDAVAASLELIRAELRV